MSRSKTRKSSSTCIVHRPVIRKSVEEDGTVINLIGHEQFQVTANFVMFYDNIFEILGKLDYLSILLMHYIGIRMEQDSSVHLNIHEKMKFIEIVRREGGKTFTIGSIDNALQRLKRAHFIRPLNKGTFYVNAKYATRYINNDDRKRRINANEQWRFKIENGLTVYNDPIKNITQKTHSPLIDE